MRKKWIKNTTLINADVIEGLQSLPEASIHTVVTSPPYFGLRDYQTAKWEGGDPKCDHRHKMGGEGKKSSKQNTSIGTQTIAYKDICAKCGAKRIDKQIGLEDTPEEFVEKLVDVFKEIKRVLRDDGTVWLNLGSCYAGSGKAGNNPEYWKKHKEFGKNTGDNPERYGRAMYSSPPGYKPKDLIPIPWIVAIALQKDGWTLRSDIIWHKKNPMPSSVRDRPTMNHEYIFLLSKKAHYFYDVEAIKEPTVTRDVSIRDRDNTKLNNTPGRTKMGGLKTNQYAYRNKRTVWTVTTQPFPGAHFATFPEALVRIPVLSGCPEKCCSKCGAPWVNEIERIDTGKKQKMPDGFATYQGGHGSFHKNGREKGKSGVPVMASIVIGTRPTCSCNADPVPGIVLDPFAGSGTVAVVAEKLHRRSIMIELSEEYFNMMCNRVRYGVVEEKKVEQVKNRINMQLLSPEEL